MRTCLGAVCVHVVVIPSVGEYCMTAFEINDVFGEVEEEVPGERKISLSELC